MRGRGLRAGALVFLLAALAGGPVASAASILFVGNSFTFAFGSAVRYYRADMVTDFNGGGQGGVAALFKSFADQTGLSYDVFMEAQSGVGLEWHLEHKLDAITRRPWDIVVLQGFSTLDQLHPGDPTILIASVRRLAQVLHARNPAGEIRLMATWPRADQIYRPRGAWYGKPIEAMAREVRAGYDRAAASSPFVKAVIPVGEAWVRAIRSGIADANPYDGIDAGKLDLWAYEGHHASTYGTYLEALVLFGSITHEDPRSLGAAECSGYELGLSPAQVGALQQVAFDQLAAEGAFGSGPARPARKYVSGCAAPRCRPGGPPGTANSSLNRH